VSSSISAEATSTVELTVGIVVAYVSNNSVPVAELPTLIAHIHSAVVNLALGVATIEPSAIAHEAFEKPSPSAIRKSIQHDGIISFLDGKTYKTLKRHLTSHGLDPHSYRTRYGLPADYPMVAPEYAERRAALAKAIGLGRPGAMAEREWGDRRAA
jgi:predicted transcriptional regulator